mmetsp:Transcript_22664/g.49669  ORF Transcript_22664/g.49669 Transcript_22664/m.49669 type:complete len:224 (+) Transcript_22664:719-1390(+)
MSVLHLLGIAQHQIGAHHVEKSMKMIAHLVIGQWTTSAGPMSTLGQIVAMTMMQDILLATLWMMNLVTSLVEVAHMVAMMRMGLLPTAVILINLLHHHLGVGSVSCPPSLIEERGMQVHTIPMMIAASSPLPLLLDTRVVVRDLMLVMMKMKTWRGRHLRQSWHALLQIWRGARTRSEIRSLRSAACPQMMNHHSHWVTALQPATVKHLVTRGLLDSAALLAL